jgi:hypothetical protein
LNLSFLFVQIADQLFRFVELAVFRRAADFRRFELFAGICSRFFVRDLFDKFFRARFVVDLRDFVVRD